ncbi:MAG: YceI family protein [Candidatus Eremiobacteraeota bacterium]|nr:YceI family protein [Candidatus Eremiobacteraeota bacterium]MBV8433947.1 YceI family protein [Candidatus Eremiobacteraeota bacterium]MBV8721388.1 YceI family protein [Candidatus Eremiobacteraeota bacterium]
MIALLAAVSLLTRHIDPGRSTAAFSVQHIYVERVTGTVPILSGDVTFDPKTLLPSAVSASLDATKLKTDDEDRDAALRSPDWFDTNRFPQWTFVSTAMTPTGAQSCTISGLLTIHGVTRPQQLDVAASGSPERPQYKATAHVDRHAFGMSTARLDPVIGNQVDVTLDVVLE